MITASTKVPAVVPFADLRGVWEEGHESLLRQARALAPFLGIPGLLDLESLRPGSFPVSPAALEAGAKALEDLADRMQSKAELFAFLSVALGAWADEVEVEP